MLLPLGSGVAQSCPSGKTLIFSDKRRVCLDDYPTFRDMSVEVRGKVLNFSKAHDDFGGYLAVAASECGATGTSWVPRPTFAPQAPLSIEQANAQAIKNCTSNFQKHSIDPKRFECECTIVLNANSLSNHQIVVERARGEFDFLFKNNPVTASAMDRTTPAGNVNQGEVQRLAAERFRLENERQALERARQAKIKEDEDRQKERARLETDRQLLEKTRVAQIKETEQRTKEIARLEAEAKARDQKMRAEVQSRTTTVDERFQQSKATGSVGSWAIYKSGVPFQQQQFCRITENFRQEIDDARNQKNQIKENIALRTREQRLTALLPDGNFSNWIVRAVSVKQASDGSAAVLFELPCDVIIGSHACGQNVKFYRGTISENSRLYSELALISVGDFLGVSGTFSFVDETVAFQKGRSVASFRAMAADSHCEAKDVAKPGVDFFASSIQTLSNLK